MGKVPGRAENKYAHILDRKGRIRYNNWCVIIFLPVRHYGYQGEKL
jgi:hypothetical protein